MFSPIFAISARRRSSTVSPLSSLAASRASSRPAPTARAFAATAWAKPRKSCSRATKSVSQLISTMAAVRLSADFSIVTTPSAAMRAAFLSALASPCLRISSAAASRSPLVSTRAFLHSIMPAPVLSRSCLTVSAVIFMGVLLTGSAAAAFTAAPSAATRGPTIGVHWGHRRNSDDGCDNRRVLDVQILIIDVRDNLGRITASGRRDRRRPAPCSSFLAHVRLRAGSATTTTGGLLARVTGLVELDELVLAGGHRGYGLPALDHSIRHSRRIQLNGTHRIVVARNDIINAI